MTLEFGIWLVVVLGILGLGMGSMVQAYRRPLKNVVLFPVPLSQSSQSLSETTQAEFAAGCRAFTLGQFPRAIEAFTTVIEREPACGEAVHNVGLAQANLGNDGLAVRALLQASGQYDQQDNRPGFDQVKRQLEQLAERRRGMGTKAVVPPAMGDL